MPLLSEVIFDTYSSQSEASAPSLVFLHHFCLSVAFV